MKNEVFINHSSGTYKEHFDAFMSYRRETGSHLANLLKIQLENNYNKQIFLDIKELQKKIFDEMLLNQIEETSNYILILNKNSVDQCKSKVLGFKITIFTINNQIWRIRK